MDGRKNALDPARIPADSRGGAGFGRWQGRCFILGATPCNDRWCMEDEMNKIAVALIVAALISPAFAQETKTPVKKEATKKVQTHKPMAKKAKKAKPVAQSSLSGVHNPDYPWMLPA